MKSACLMFVLFNLVRRLNTINDNDVRMQVFYRGWTCALVRKKLIRCELPVKMAILSFEGKGRNVVVKN